MSSPQQPTWSDIAKQLPPDLPPEAYDAQRDAFFRSAVLPDVMSKGLSPEAVRQEFMKQTERPSFSFPRTAVIAREAASSFAKPILGLTGGEAGQELKHAMEHKAEEAQQISRTQGVSPTIPSFVGSGLGMAPYFAPMGAIAGLPGLSGLAAEATMSGALNGAYEAASADPDHRTKAGFVGAGLGFVLGAAGGELTKGLPLTKFLISKKNLPKAVAKAIDQTAKGTASEAEKSLADETLQMDPSLHDDVLQHQQSNSQAASSAGVPAKPSELRPNDPVQIIGQTPQGQQVPVTPPQVPEFLEQGGMVASASGPASGVHVEMDKIGKRAAADGRIPWDDLMDRINKRNTTYTPITSGDFQQISNSLKEEGSTKLGKGGGGLILLTKGEPGDKVGLDDITGLLVSKEGLNKELNLNGNRHAIANELQVLMDTSYGNNIPMRIFDTDKQMASYRAQLGNTPMQERFALSRRTQERYEEQQAAVRPTGMELARTPTMLGEEGTGGMMMRYQRGNAAQQDRDILRGSTNIPLSAKGMQQAKLNGEGLGSRIPRGSDVEFYSSNLDRTLETTRAIAMHTGGGINPDHDFTPMHWGMLEGQPVDDILPVMKQYIKDHPEIQPPGRSPHSGEEAESFNNFSQRNLSKFKTLINYSEAHPEKYVFAMTHYRNVKNLEAWLKNGAPDDLSIDVDTMLHDGKDPGAMWKVSRGDDGKLQMHQIDPRASSELPPGFYVGRHSYTEWNKGGRDIPANSAFDAIRKHFPYMPPERAKELADIWESTGQRPLGLAPPAQSIQRPLYQTMVGPEAEQQLGPLGEGVNAASYSGENQYPTLAFAPGHLNKDTLMEEGMHANIGFTGVADSLAKDWMDAGGGMFHFTALGDSLPDYAKQGPDVLAEESFIEMAKAVRFGNRERLQQFADADGGMAKTMKWFTERAQNLRDVVANAPDSTHKTVLDRRLTAVVNRATPYLEDLDQAPAPLGMEVGMRAGRYYLKSPNGDLRFFDDREDLANTIDNMLPPYTTPESIDLSELPDTIRFASTIKSMNPAKAPPQGPPLHPDISGVAPLRGPGKPIRNSYLNATFYVQPNYSWLSSVATKHDWPELWDVFSDVRQAKIDMNNDMAPAIDALKDTLFQHDTQRQRDFAQFFAAPTLDKDRIAKELHITPEEMHHLDQFGKEFNERYIDPLTGKDFLSWMRGDLPRLAQFTRDPDAFSPSGSHAGTTASQLWAHAVSNGELDPREPGLGQLASQWLQVTMKRQWMDPALARAARLVNQVDAKGQYRAGGLQPLLKRFLEYERSRPDLGQRAIHGVMQTAFDLVNERLIKVNNRLRSIGSPEIPYIDISPRDALRKWISLTYAGALGLRAMVPIRDSMQMFITGYPILGNYLFKGIRDAFPSAMKQSSEATLVQVARQYGALLRQDDFLKYLTGEQAGKIGKMTQAAMRSITWSHNSNRLATFAGGTRMVLDALKQGVDDSFLSRSGLAFVDAAPRQRFLQEAASLTGATPDVKLDFARRVAKELVDITQWNYDRSAAPGFHKYAIGRLFGQYGVFPLNYINYSRRLLTSGSGADRMAALTRLAVAHFAILKAGEGLGVNTADWVFTQPMAYGGGPMFQAVTHLPESLNFETQRGTEARRDVVEPIWPLSVPGGLAFDRLYKALRNDENVWPVILGFRPYTESEEGKGWHALPPWVDTEVTK